MVKISIILPIFNNEKHLNESLDSIINQSLKDLEIICINDGSTDGSGEILNGYREDSRITIINQSNRGPALSRNRGIEMAQGEYVGFLDGDDIFIDENALETMYEYGKANDASIVSGNLKFLTSGRELIDNPHYDRKTFYYFHDYTSISPDEYGIPFYFYKNLYRSDLIKDIRFPDLKRGEDPVFLTKVLGKTGKVYGVPVDFYGYMVPISYSKLDSYEKKHDYIVQYRECFNILAESGLNETLDKYIHNLILYLTDNVDSEVYELVENIFKDDMSIFKDYEEEYMEFKVNNLLNNVLEKNTEEYYELVKNELSEVDDLEILKKSENLQEYKIKYFESKLSSYSAEHRELVKVNSDLKEKYNLEKSFNDKVKSSRRWKILNVLRKLRG
ncbi:glycosyltransferase family 2 protein [Methanobrevibacter sp.]